MTFLSQEPPLKNHVAQTLKSVSWKIACQGSLRSIIDQCSKMECCFYKKFVWNIRVKRQDHIGNMKKVLGIFLTSFE